jgi:hypothetical protein
MARIGKHPSLLLLAREAGKLLSAGIVRGNDCLLSMQNGRILAVIVCMVSKPERLQRYDQGTEERGVGVRVEIRIGEVGNLRFAATKLYHICSLYLSDIGPSTALINA